VFLTDHPQHGEFLEAMRDPRLRQPIVMPGDLQPFLDRSVAADRLIQQD
jgi:hypothetical protein